MTTSIGVFGFAKIVTISHWSLTKASYWWRQLKQDNPSIPLTNALCRRQDALFHENSTLRHPRLFCSQIFRIITLLIVWSSVFFLDECNPKLQEFCEERSLDYHWSKILLFPIINAVFQTCSTLQQFLQSKEMLRVILLDSILDLFQLAMQISVLTIFGDQLCKNASPLICIWGSNPLQSQEDYIG